MSDWITEKEAMKLLNRKDHRRMRTLIKSGAWPIVFTAPNGRGYMYSLKSINKFLDSFSSKTKQSA